MIDHHVDVGGVVLRALAPRHQTLATGEPVYLWMEPGQCLGMAS